MAAPSSRASLITYCKQKLGEPVIQVNIADEQVSDRIDDCLQFYRQFHFDGIAKGFRKHTITQDDIDNEFIAIPDTILSVTGIIKQSIINLAVQQQVILNNIPSISSGFTNYYMDQMNLSLFENLFNIHPGYQFNKVTDKLTLNTVWATDFDVGEVLVMEVHEIMDPETYTEIYDDIWLKQLATAMIKRQWGENLKKFGSIKLPGGVILNGKEIYDEAKEEITALKEELRDTWSEPVGFILG